MKTQYKSIILILMSIISSGFAQGLTIIAIPWHFTDVLNQSSTFSLLYAIITFIGLFWGLYAGVVIDNYNRKKILLYINLISSICFGVIGYFCSVLTINHPLILMLGFAICSFYYIIFFPNLYAMMQELTSKKEYVKINSLIEVFMQTTNILAAITCGLLLSGSENFRNYFNILNVEFSKWDIDDVFLLNSALYLITFIILVCIRYQPITIRKKRSQKIITDIQNGFMFLVKNKNILIYGVCSQIIFAFLIVELFTLLPLFVKKCLNETIIVFSFADVVYGMGAILAGLITSKFLQYIEKWNFTIFLITTTCFAIILMIQFQELNMFFIATLIIGVTNASARITRMSYFYERIPNNVMGRTNTIFNSINTLIRGFLILIFSMPWLSQGVNVIIGYKIGIYILILFSLPLIWIKQKKLN